MIPGKTNLIILEEFAAKQIQIYDDAADYGVILDKGNRDRLRKATIELKKMWSGKITRWGDWTGNRSRGSETTLFIPVERDHGGIVGYFVTVTYNLDTIRKVEFLTIDIERKIQASEKTRPMTFKEWRKNR